MKDELLKVLIEGAFKGLGEILTQAGKVFSNYKREDKNDQCLPQRQKNSINPAGYGKSESIK